VLLPPGGQHAAVTRLPRLIHVLEAQQYEAVVARVVTTTLEQSPDRLHTKVVETCLVYLLEDIRGEPLGDIKVTPETRITLLRKCGRPQPGGHLE
jgi:hypothetical protein